MLLSLNAMSEAAIAAITHAESQTKSAASTRSGFVRTLEECIGPRPKTDWKTEWLALNTEVVKSQSPQLSEAEAELKARGFMAPRALKKTDPEEYARREAIVLSTNDPAELTRTKLETYQKNYEWRVAAGWLPAAGGSFAAAAAAACC